MSNNVARRQPTSPTEQTRLRWSKESSPEYVLGFGDTVPTRDIYPMLCAPRERLPARLAKNAVCSWLLSIQKTDSASEPVSVGGRGERIRTSDLSVPNAALYQAEPRPVIIGAGGGSRTHMKLPSMVFETIASAIPPLRLVMPGCTSLTN